MQQQHKEEEEEEEEEKRRKQCASNILYSPLGALYNMNLLPPNGTGGSQDDAAVTRQLQSPTAPSATKRKSNSSNNSTSLENSSRRQQQPEELVKDQPCESTSSKFMWTPDRLISSLPPGTYTVQQYPTPQPRLRLRPLFFVTASAFAVVSQARHSNSLPSPSHQQSTIVD